MPSTGSRTIARELPDAVRNAIETQRVGGTYPVRASVVDPYLAFIRETLDQHPRLRATRIYQMARDRGYTGGVGQLRRAVARLRQRFHLGLKLPSGPESVAVTNDSPPGPTVDGLIVNEASGGVGGAVPPGFSVTV